MFWILFLTFLINLVNCNVNDINYPWLEQITRQEQLIKECQHVPGINIDIKNMDFTRSKDTLNHLLVEHQHKLLYCYVPKVACTNWKRVFMVLSGVANTSNLISIPGSLAHNENSTLRLSYIENNTEIHEILNNYITFIVVRHPFERLLSAYRNKFENTYSQYFRLRYGRDIIKKYRKNPTEQDLNTGNNVSFREFILFLLDGGYLKNEHWAPVYNLCHPCYINYTLVVRYETLTQDSKMILDLVDAPYINFPETRVANTAEKLKFYYKQLLLEEVKNLYKLYWTDFKLFGYTLDDLLGFDFAL